MFQDDVPNFHDTATQTEDIPGSKVDASAQSDITDPVNMGGEVFPGQVQVPGEVLPDAGSTTPAASFSWTAAHISVDATTSPSLADQVKQAAESAMQQTGFVYEATSGMYYDYSTGYYYDAVSISNMASTN
ncbi:hypothetical protein PR048_026150 [Dryococelus australis]|uniref:OCRE domain-containing protein n=1 Tax=Dryococelus australis TaxID=614101 RepID=A0ABQ9GKK5_9NEOP|nr:hypothetical protein PR048_026150 [Dryococelus australis]